MKLTLANGETLNIDNVNNRQNLTLKTGYNKDYEQSIIFSIFNTSREINFEELIEKIRNNNTDFTLTYGEGDKIETYEGWQLSDLTEEITDDHRVITLLATKIKATE